MPRVRGDGRTRRGLNDLNFRAERELGSPTQANSNRPNPWHAWHSPPPKPDTVRWHAETHEDLATVLERSGRIDEAREELARALAIWERKGCLPCAQRVRDQIASLARLALATAEARTDTVRWHAETHEDLATVLERSGRIDEAREELARALAIWERKGCLPCAQRVRDQIASLGSTASRLRRLHISCTYTNRSGRSYG